MRARSLATLTLLLASVALAGCDSNDEDNQATLQGSVVNADTDQTIAGAFVRISGAAGSSTIQTDSSGMYSYTYEFSDEELADESVDPSATLSISAFADGFEDGAAGSSTSIEVFAGGTRTVQDLRLLPIGSSGTGTGGGEEATVEGNVVNLTNAQPVVDAFVRVVGPDGVYTGRTDEDGAYSIVYVFPVNTPEDDLSAQLDIEAFADGFEDGSAGSSVSVQVFANATRQAPVISLTPIGSDGGGGGGTVSGPARSVTLESRSAETITVAGAGGTNEVALLTFIVYDAQGRPVSGDNAVEVSFDITTPQPGSVPERASLSTDMEETDDSGRAYVYLTSGTLAQTVQVRASFTSASGELITSSPVAVVIAGGLPSQDNFSLAATDPNFGPAFSVAGLTQSVVAYVGDRYGNPVVEGTTVYFSTNGGQIQGTGVTDALGRAQVTLLSTANPPITDPRGPGFVTVRASTVGEGGATVEETASILFSGAPIVRVTRSELISLTDTTRAYELDFTVSDVNGNPLGPGTSIVVSAQGENVVVSGDRFGYSGSVQVGGPGITEFSTGVGPGNLQDDSYLSAVIIDVSGPNGTTQRGVGVNALLYDAPEPPEEEPDPEP